MERTGFGPFIPLVTERTDYFATADHITAVSADNGRFFTDVTLHVPGLHNVKNALAATAACICVGVRPTSVKYGLAGFTGAGRRFEFKGKFNGADVYDDYAHHPDELKAAISSVKALYPDKKLTAAFQPHLFSRTRDFAPQFAEALSLADSVILLDIYPARELPIPGVTSQIIFDEIKCEDKQMIVKEDLIETIKNSNFEILLTVGAGDICNYLPEICRLTAK